MSSNLSSWITFNLNCRGKGLLIAKIAGVAINCVFGLPCIVVVCCVANGPETLPITVAYGAEQPG